MTPLDNVLQKLETKGCPPKKRGNQWQAKCPSHEDRSPSLSIGEGDDGRVLLHCFAGCAPRDISQALDLTIEDLFVGGRSTKGVDDYRYKSEYRYHDQEGELAYRVVKYVDDTGRKTFRQQAWNGERFQTSLGNKQRVIYSLPRILRGIAECKPIWIVEGEKDAENMTWQCGAYATCNPGGADNGSGNKFTASMIAQLDKARIVNICIDNDQPGVLHGQYLARNLKAPVRVYRSTTGKDISEHLIAGHTLEELELVYDSSSPNGWLADTVADVPSPIDNGWRLESVDQWLTGDREETLPTILRRNDEQGLFYAGKINSLFGESGCGKTWLLLEALAQEIKEERNVAYLDFEDRGTTFVDRLRNLGCTDEQISKHAQYAHPLGASLPEEIDYLADQLIGMQCTIVGIDSAGEGLAVADLNPNADEEVAAWYREIPRRLAATGASVILVDHLPKNTEHSKLSAIGSQRKKAAIDGASHLVKMKMPIAKGSTEPGLIETYCAKDRHGTYPTGTITATISLSAGVDTLAISVLNPSDPLADGKPTLPADMGLVRRIVEWCEAQPVDRWSKNEFETRKQEFDGTLHPTRAAIKAMIADQILIPEGTLWRINVGAKVGDEIVTSSAPRHPAENNTSSPRHPSSPPRQAGRQHLVSENGQANPLPRQARHTPMVLRGDEVDEIEVEPHQYFDDDPFNDDQLFEAIPDPRRHQG